MLTMDRISIEDCNKYVSNRFDLVLVAAQRGKELNHGSLSRIDNKKDKEAVIALREIASGFLNIKTLEKSIVQKNFMNNQEEVVLENNETSEEISSKSSKEPGIQTKKE